MNKLKKLAVIAFLLTLGFSCQDKKEPKISGPTPDPAQLSQRLERVELRWEILQKDNPPQIESTNFRINLADAKKAMAETNYALAGGKILDAENWLNQVSNRYYVVHRENLKAGIVKEDPKQVWEKAENFWAREAEYFMAGNQGYAGIAGSAGYEEAELAVISAIASDLTTLEKTKYCLKLSEREARVGDRAGAEKWRGEAKKLLEKRIELISDQVNWCLSGTVPICDPVQVKESKENYLQAKKILEDSWKEIQELVNFGNQVFPGGFQMPGLGGRIQAWINEQENFFLKIGQLPGASGFQDFQALKEQERQKEKELVAKYNQLYCQKGEDLNQFGLSLEKTDVKFEAGKLIFQFRLTNLNSEPIYKPRIRLCGGVVSEEIYLGYERYPGNHQTSFSVPVLGLDAEDLTSGQYQIPAYWVLITFEDSPGKTWKAKAIFNP